MAAEPATPTLTVFGVALLSLLPGVDAAVVLGSFAGAVLFVTSSDEFSAAKKIGFFLPAFAGGLLGAATASKAIEAVLFGAVAVSPGVGALLAATVTVKLLIWVLGQNIETLLALVRRKP